MALRYEIAQKLKKCNLPTQQDRKMVKYTIRNLFTKLYH